MHKYITKMRIKTITCHDCYNLGASLQAYALQHYLETQGHNVQIINYKPYYLSGHFKLGSVSNPKYNRPIVKQLYLLAKLPGRLLSLSRKKAFDRFTAKYLHLTRRYNSYEELKADAPDADVYIAGSDQIWNTLFPNGRDAAFYLDFGKPNVRRISYAASFATKDVAHEYREFVNKELKNLDFVSIREKISLPLLYSLGRKDGVAVCDPVFLLSKKEWIILTNESPIKTNEKYLVVYLTDKSEEIKRIALDIYQTTGWKIYVVGAFRETWAHKNFVNADPLDFVKLINDAQYIISNSFHATAFSLILEKNFCVVNRKEGINERMKSVLTNYGLTDRMVNCFSKSILKRIDYSSVNRQMEKDILFSKEWLNNLLKV